MATAQRDGYNPDRYGSHNACSAETLSKVERVRHKLIGEVPGSPTFFCPTPAKDQEHQHQDK